MEKTVIDPRVLAILEAAFGVFTSYGYKRSTMDDIARAAGMSRPALYQHFANKQAIFRAYVVILRDRYLSAAQDSLDQAESIDAGITGAFEAAFIDPHRMLESTQHGIELIGVNKEIAADLFEDWMGGVETMLSDWISAKAKAGKINLHGAAPEAIARLLASAVEGIKTRDSDMQRASSEIRLLARMIALSLTH